MNNPAGLLPIYREYRHVLLETEQSVLHFLRYHKYGVGVDLRRQAMTIMRRVQRACFDKPKQIEPCKRWCGRWTISKSAFNGRWRWVRLPPAPKGSPDLTPLSDLSEWPARSENSAVGGIKPASRSRSGAVKQPGVKPVGAPGGPSLFTECLCHLGRLVCLRFSFCKAVLPPGCAAALQVCRLRFGLRRPTTMTTRGTSILTMAT